MNRLIGILAASLILSTTACNREEPPQTPAGTSADTDAVNGAPSGLFARQKEQLLAAAQRNLDAAQTKMDELKEKAKEAGQSASEDMQQLQQTWQEKMQQARQQLDELRDSGAEKWAGAKDKLGGLTADMENIYEKAASRIMGEAADEPPASETDSQEEQ